MTEDFRYLKQIKLYSCMKNLSNNCKKMLYVNSILSGEPMKSGMLIIQVPRYHVCNGIHLHYTEICKIDKIFPCGEWNMSLKIHLTDCEEWR